MAKKKANATKTKGGSKKNKKHNSGSASRSSSKKANPAKKHSKKHSRGKRNPFDVAGVNLTELAAAGIAAISSQAIVSVITDPTSWLGIGIGIGLAVAAAKFSPKSVKSAVTVGAGVVPAVNLINRVTKNAIGNTITSTLRGFVPAGLLGDGAAAGTGMAGPRRAGGYGGLVAVPPGFARYDG